ncbi:MAG TPA: MFS transporter, partial [Thermomicrobiales bacterium]|nr:MFS transporter [Thermomicrobiales bacterium]
VAVGTIPLVVVGIFGGAIVDRIGYRTASVIADVLSGLSVALIPLLHATTGLSFWQLLVLVFLGSFFDGPGSTARQALYPELAKGTGFTLDRANTGYNLTSRIASLLGTPLAGVLIAVLGPSDLLWVDAVSFACSAAIVLALVPKIPVEHAMAAVTGLRSYLDDVRSGFRFLLETRFLLTLILFSCLGQLLAEPIYGVILPVYANQVLDSAAELGFIFAALGAGSIVGNLIYAWVGPRFTRSQFLLGGFAVRALGFCVMLTTPDWWVIAAAIFIGAVALEPTNPMFMSLFQEQVPSGMRGRVYGALTAISAGARPTGLVGYGFLMSHMGLHPTLVLFVALNLALAVGMILSPFLRHIPQPTDVTSGRTVAEIA